MQEGFIGEMKMFAGNFAPRSWAFCDGQLLAISQNEALFSIIGTMYGGDGRTTMALPDLRGRVPIGAGRGPELTNRRQGYRSGSEGNILTVSQLPSHNHLGGHINVADGKGDSFGANGNYLASKAVDVDVTPQTTVEIFKTAGTSTFANKATLNGVETGSTGSNQVINNMQPSLGIHYIIALFGVYPTRT